MYFARRLIASIWRPFSRSGIRGGSGRRLLLAEDNPGNQRVATMLLEKMGYDVRPLKPGFEDIIKAGFPKETGEPEKK